MSDNNNDLIPDKMAYQVNKRRMAWATKCIISINFTDKRNVFAILASRIRHIGAGPARISFRDLVFDIGKFGFWAPRSDETADLGIIGSFSFA